MKNSNKIVLINFLSTVILQGMAFFAIPYFSRVMGTYNYGLFSVFSTWAQIGSIVFGLRTNGTLAVFMKDFDSDEQKKYQSSVLFLSFLSFLFFSLITFLISVLWLGRDFLIVLLILLNAFGQFVVLFLNTKNTYEFKAWSNFILSIGVSFGTIGLSVLLIYLYPANTYLARAIGETAPYTVLGVVILAVFLIRGKTLFHSGYWKYCIPLALPMVLHGLSGIILSQSDRIMLEFLKDANEVGIYSLSYSFCNVMFIIWSSLNNSWVPYFFKLSKEEQYDELKKHSNNYFELFAALSAGFLLLSPIVFKVFASQEYYEGEWMIPIFTLSNGFIFLYSFSVNYEMFHKKNIYIAIGTALSAVCNIGLNYLFISFYGMMGAAIATLISYALLFIFHIVISKVAIKEKGYIFDIAAVIIFLAVIGGFSGLYYVNMPIYVNIILASLIAVYMCFKMIKRKSIF